jgi:hypothetical protein
MYNGSVYDMDIISINEAVRRQIKRNIDQATAHLKDHTNPKGELLFWMRIVNTVRFTLRKKGFSNNKS